MIRTFELKDLIQVMGIEENSFPKTAYNSFTLLFLSQHYRFLVYDDGKILGYVVYDPKDGHIISIAVLPESRRKGIGRRLMEEVFKECKRSWLEVRASNEAAQGFYERLGFQKKGRIEGYYEDEDALVMVRESESCISEKRCD
jgi:ribosomal-protein-alanine N-acetyltransferase